MVKDNKVNKDDLPREYRGLYHFSNIPSCSISLPDLRKLYKVLNDKKHEVFDKEFENLEKPSEFSTEEFSEFKKQFLQSRDLTLIIHGSQGEQIVARSIEALGDEALPETVTGITFDSSLMVYQTNYKPINRFALRLDLSETPGSFSYDPSLQATPNNSSIEVIGPDSTWVTAVYESTLAFFDKRRKRREWLHHAAAFNIGMWLIAFPSGFWLVYRVDSIFKNLIAELPVVLSGAIYVYIVFLTLLIFRGLIGGFRWIFPLVELQGTRSGRIRGILGAVMGALLLTLLYDVLKTIFWAQ